MLILEIIGIRTLAVVSGAYLVLIPRVIPGVFVRCTPRKAERSRHKLLRKELATESATKVRANIHVVGAAPVEGPL